MTVRAWVWVLIGCVGTWAVGNAVQTVGHGRKIPTLVALRHDLAVGHVVNAHSVGLEGR